MPDLAPEIYALLAQCVPRVRYQYPQSAAHIPCAVFSESGNQVAQRADAAPHLHEITFTVENFDFGVADVRAAAAACDAAMTSKGFVRAYAADGYDDALCAFRHVARYRAVCDMEGNLTQ